LREGTGAESSTLNFDLDRAKLRTISEHPLLSTISAAAGPGVVKSGRGRRAKSRQGATRKKAR
jgi:hypothetical protein